MDPSSFIFRESNMSLRHGLRIPIQLPAVAVVVGEYVLFPFILLLE